MLNRRNALQSLSVAPTLFLTPAASSAPRRKVLRVAGIGTQYFKNSHCDVIFTKIMQGWDHLGFEDLNFNWCRCMSSKKDRQ